MEASFTAVATAGDDPDHLASVDRLADVDRRRDRLVRGTARRMGHSDDAAASDGCGEGHYATARSLHGRPRRRGEVDPAVSGEPILRGWIKRSNHLQRSGKWR